MRGSAPGPLLFLVLRANTNKERAWGDEGYPVFIEFQVSSSSRVRVRVDLRVSACAFYIIGPAGSSSGAATKVATVKLHGIMVSSLGSARLVHLVKKTGSV